MTSVTKTTNHIWITIGTPEDIPEQGGALFKVLRLEDPRQPREVAVFRIGSEFAAIDARCPHQGAKLDGCRIDREGKIECPLHYWRFDVRSGQCDQSPAPPLGTYPIAMFGGKLKIRVPVDADALGIVNSDPGKTPGER